MRRERSSLLRYGGALVVVLLALLLRWQLTPWLGSRSPVSLFVLAILISAQYGGLAPGLLATGLSTLTVVHFFEQPGGVLTIANPADRVALALFALLGIGISGFASGRRLLEDGGLTLSLELPERPVWMEGDPTRLAQIVGNLLQNASKFTDRGGRVTVRLALEAAGKSFTTETRRQADRSLDRTRGGLGLGLALVKGLPEGVETARRFQPEVVLCDLGLPGIDGYQVATELRRHADLARARLIASRCRAMDRKKTSAVPGKRVSTCT